MRKHACAGGVGTRDFFCQNNRRNVQKTGNGQRFRHFLSTSVSESVCRPEKMGIKNVCGTPVERPVANI